MTGAMPSTLVKFARNSAGSRPTPLSRDSLRRCGGTSTTPLGGSTSTVVRTGSTSTLSTAAALARRPVDPAMHVLVTGANGLIGSRVVARLGARGHTVVALGRGPRRLAGGDYRSVDLTDESALVATVKAAHPEI